MRPIWKSALFALALIGSAMLVKGAAEPASRPVVLSPEQAEKEGKALAAELRSARPPEDSLVTGKLEVRKGKSTTSMAIQCEVVRSNSTWQTIYRVAGLTHCLPETLVVVHSKDAPNQYFFAPIQTNYDSTLTTNGTNIVLTPLPPKLRPLTLKEAENLAFGMGNSDFSATDLGLEFFHWPTQRLVKKEMRRGRSCRVLESVNPSRGRDGGYSRVLSWIDNETAGIVVAEAYDSKNRVVKEFAPKDFKKVNGQWELEEMEISNRQTGSRTRITFQVGSP